jgi:nucleotide-binding universal stress UspA family protein
MFQHVMWATDGSDAADQALPFAKSLAAAGGGGLLVVHCEEFMTPGKGMGNPHVHIDEDELQAKIERQVAELSAGDVEVSLRTMKTRAGGAAHAIADAAREAGSDVIVVGTRGRTTLAGLLLGGVTQRLLHITPCPVLAVPTSGPDAEG